MNKDFLHTDLSQLKFSFDAGTARILYYRHKAYITPIIVILVSFLVFIFVVLGQVSDFLSAKDQIVVEQQKITILEQNQNTLASLNDVSDNLQIAEQALPVEKDFAGIVNAIAETSSLTGVSVADYSFQVGSLSDTQSGAVLNIPVMITLQSGPDNARRFLTTLAKTSPLSSVVSFESDAASTTVRILFYYKPLPRISVDYATPIKPLSQSNQDLLKILSDWQTETKAGAPSVAKPATASASL